MQYSKKDWEVSTCYFNVSIIFVLFFKSTIVCCVLTLQKGDRSMQCFPNISDHKISLFFTFVLFFLCVCVNYVIKHVL